ncbi:DNA-binding protein HU-beta [Gammaproteobacteria bacterium]
MNKTDLIGVIAKSVDISKAAAGRALDAVICAITDSLGKGKPVALVGFGTFVVNKRKQRTGRNPQTGAAITIPAAKVPRFKAGKNLKDKVNNK